MKRLLLGMLVGLLLGVVMGAAVGIRAEPSQDVVAAADAAGVDPVQLEAALLTVGTTDPWLYLRHAGHLPWPRPAVPAWTVWDTLARCEATGNWAAVSPGGRYRGGIQADATFWARYGGLAFAPTADRASREQQIIVAQRGLASQGWAAWPICSRRLGLR